MSEKSSWSGTQSSLLFLIFFSFDYFAVFFSNEEKKEKQREVFRIQLDMAVKQQLPIVIHCRNDESHGGGYQAELDCFEIMKEVLRGNGWVFGFYPVS